ncbi:MAG: hypothetical protein KKF77_13410 [Proteobacteria bacterium]|nr:hypothetical protein [Pseudomonadota bacterium]
MRSLVEELWTYATSNPKYSTFHRGCCDNTLELFLFSTMDEVRLRHAEEYAESILRITFMQDASFFRKSLLRREAAGEFSYAKQRDHAAHTLYNYLIGWYIYTNSYVVGEEMARHLKTRGWEGNSTEFGSTWPFLSLLHDIGYIFEGSLGPLSTAIQSEQAKIGVDIAHEYFCSEFWSVNCLDSEYDRRVLQRLIGDSFFQPSFSCRSLAQVADALRYLGNLETLRAQLLTRLRESFPIVGQDDVRMRELSRGGGLPGDAFDLWEMHYRFFENKKMVKHIQSLRDGFYNLLRFGRTDMGIRHLDHGVCSGLLALLYSTVYFVIFFALEARPLESPADKRVYHNFRVKAAEGADMDVDALWWWTNVVWATAGAAMHNIQQIGHLLGLNVKLAKIHLKDDPLAYLGILADIIQDWDRYGVSGVSSLTGALPVQGKDVKLGVGGGKILIRYGDPKRVKAITNDLDRALYGWKDLICLE